MNVGLYIVISITLIIVLSVVLAAHIASKEIGEKE